MRELFRQRVLSVLMAGGACLVFIGCQPADRAPTDTGDGTPTAAVDAPEAGADPQPEVEVSLTSIDGDGLRQRIEELHGHVVLVDFWATWCGPCREKFPHVVQMARENQQRGLRLITVSIDDPGDRDRALEFLDEQQPPGDNYITAFDLGESFEVFELVSVPTYRLYDRQGQLVEEFDVHNMAELDSTVDRVVAQEQAATSP